METGGVGDGHSWAEQVKASNEEEWRGRPMKHHRSLSRRREGGSTNPFPLQDHERRCEATQQLYQHTGELRLACHDVAAEGMARHHPDMEPHEAKSLNNQVLCMILEYHLTSLNQGSSCVSPVFPEAVKDLLPPIEEYLVDSGFQGTWDLRVLQKAWTLRVVIWHYCLDMAAAGDGTASFSLDAARHGRGPLVEFLLAPQGSSLMFEEVIPQVLSENWDKVESSLNDVQELWAWLWRELDNLSQACQEEPGRSSWKKIKREMEQRQKDLKATISQYEACLGRARVQPEGTPASEDDPSDSGAEGEEVEMATTPVAEDAPPVSTMPAPLTAPPGEEPTCSMEMDDKDNRQPPASPVSPREDELLTGGEAVGMEGEMANLMVSSPKDQDGNEGDASI